MRVLLILLLIVAAFIGYHLYHQEPIQKPTQQPAVEQPATVVPSTQRIDCPSCKGEGQLMQRTEGGRDKPYTCARCNGRGFREIRMPASGQAMICPDCQGMAKRLYDPQQMIMIDGNVSHGTVNRLTVRACSRCLGQGYLARPKSP